ncbi:MAG: hypothetical protein AAFZ15_30345 [Bacteroidota bacterium]
MKQLAFLFLLFFTATACQKDETNVELESILAKEILDEKAQQLATEHGLQIIYVMSDTRTTVCTGPEFTSALSAYVASNQAKANQTCKVVKGPVSGCLEGFMTYGSAIVQPEEKHCPEFVAPNFDPYH